MNVRGLRGSDLRAKASRIAEMIRKELLQLRRDPRLRRMLIVSPIIQLIVFGYAVSTDVRHTATFLVDQDRSAASRELVEAFTASGYFDVVEASEAPRDLVSALDHGRVGLGLVIPAGFGADLPKGEASVQVLVDGTNSNIATVALGYAEGILRNYGARAVMGRTPSGPSSDGSRAGPITLAERAWYNPSLESRNYNVPAVVGTLITLIALLMTALAVVREREIGTLEQLMVSPLTPGELILGKTLPFSFIAFFDLALVTMLAVFWFGVPFRGSVFVLLVASVLFLMAALGAGLLISTVSSTQQQAFMATFLTFMPAMLLSGFMFPVTSMPVAFQWATLANPLRHYLEVVRAVFLKGAGFSVLWPQLLALLGLGVALLTLATRRFHKRAA